MRKQSIFIFSLLVILAGCKKLPKETHKGKDMMACYVNGEKWVAKDRSWGFNMNIGTGTTSHNPSVIKVGNELWIYGESGKKNQGYIYITIQNFLGAGEYYLSDRYNSLTNFGEYDPQDKIFFFTTDSNNTGGINIKYYEEGKVCAGTFSFNAISRNKGEIINITEGRFDIGTFD